MTTTSHVESAPEAPSFADFGLHDKIVSALAEAGIHTAFPIQAMTLPLALAKNDVIGQAKTGTGKTLGFGLPLLHNVVAPDEPGFTDLTEPGKPQALIVVPTRELAVQVSQDLEVASKHRKVRIVTIYGGRSYESQTAVIDKGVEVVVGTPGRLLDLTKQKKLSLAQARCVVLDEADEMLDLGFLPDVEKILDLTPAGRQTLLFSATMPGPVISIARTYMTQPTHIRATEPGDESRTVENVKQLVYRAHAMDKIELLAKVLQAEERGLTIVFTQTKRTADKVCEELVRRGFAAAAIHGNLGQGAREQALRAFRNKKIDVLIATDVAARGIDVDDVTHVVNYQCPEDDKTFLHRVGRTGRAGRSGVAITLIDWDDMHRWKLVDQALGLGQEDPPETYSTSPHIFTDLGIPEKATGSLPRSQRTREGLDAEKLEDIDGGKSRRSSRGGGRGGRSRSGGNTDTTERPKTERKKRPPRKRRRVAAPGAADSVGSTSSAASTSQPEDTAGATAAGSTGADGETRRPRRRRRRRRSSAQSAPAQD